MQDRLLLSIESQLSLKTADDLWKLLQPDSGLPEIFSTAQLAEACEIPRWLAQKAAWCFRRMEYLELAGKQGNSLLYRRPARPRKRRRAA